MYMLVVLAAPCCNDQHTEAENIQSSHDKHVARVSPRRANVQKHAATDEGRPHITQLAVCGSAVHTAASAAIQMLLLVSAAVSADTLQKSGHSDKHEQISTSFFFLLKWGLARRQLRLQGRPLVAG